MLWTGDSGERLQASDGRRMVCAWSDGHQPASVRSKPILAATIGSDGGTTVHCDAALESRDRDGALRWRQCHPLIARSYWLASGTDRTVCAGEQGIFAIVHADGAVHDLAAEAGGPAHAGRIKRLWNLGGDRFLICNTFGTFVSADGGSGWTLADGPADIMHVRRCFRDGQGTLIATRDGIFASADGAVWRALPWTGDGRAYGKLSGIGRLGTRLLWGGSGGLWMQDGAAPGIAVPSLLGQRIEDIVPSPGGGVEVLTHAGTLLRLDADGHPVGDPIALPSQDGRTLVYAGGRRFVIGRSSLQVGQQRRAPSLHRLEDQQKSTPTPAGGPR